MCECLGWIVLEMHVCYVENGVVGSLWVNGSMTYSFCLEHEQPLA